MPIYKDTSLFKKNIIFKEFGNIIFKELNTDMYLIYDNLTHSLKQEEYTAI